jgi:phytoene dehydrogenase-like protein
VTLTLDRDPGFTTLTIAPSLDYLERAYDDVKYGRMSAEPWLEARYSNEERRHRVDVHVQYTPYALRPGVWDDQRREALARAVVERLSRHVVAIEGAVTEAAVRSPLDLERARGVPQGQLYHAELALDQLLWMRPVPDLARYRTPIRGLYLCGPAMHPGAGIAGASGRHAARASLRDIGKSA